MNSLSTDQIAAWRRDGFLFPFPLLDAGERQECLDGLARFEGWLGAPVNATKDLNWRTMPHITLPWVTRLARDPRILDRIEALIGPDILVWTSTFFIKEPGTPTIAAWHQDSTYYGLEPREEAAAWIALTDANSASGCMEVLSFDGAPKQMRHAAHVIENSVNRAGQEITEPIDDSRPVAMELRAGQFSIHHGLCLHRSGPNTAEHRRIGLGINFIPAHAKPTGALRTAAMLVRGEDRWGHFELIDPPKTELDADAVAAHDRAVGLYRETYCEQEALHARQYG